MSEKKVLIIGSGGREHALSWKLIQEGHFVYCIPGNPGIAEYAHCIPGDIEDIHGLLQKAKNILPDLTVVGPELPLTLGIADLFSKSGLQIFGPSGAAARIEGSKSFCTRVLEKAGVPIPRTFVCTTLSQAMKTVYKWPWPEPMVIKADGLAAGKGVFIAKTPEEAKDAVFDLMVNAILGRAGRDCIVIQEFLKGAERSQMVITDGKTAIPLLEARDYKLSHDSDRGAMTGGMGAYCPARMDPLLREKVMTSIVLPTLETMRRCGYPFQGIMYFGLMLTAEGPKVLEINCRFGDPEAQVILPLLESDLYDLLYAASAGNLSLHPPKFNNQKAVGVVLASEGYPGKPIVGRAITGVVAAEQLGYLIFHAGTKLTDDKLVTSGGRVITAVAVQGRFDEARSAAYTAAELVKFERKHFRQDIAFEVDESLKNPAGIHA